MTKKPPSADHIEDVEVEPLPSAEAKNDSDDEPGLPSPCSPEVIAAIKKVSRKAAREVVRTEVASWAAPLPPPEIFERYPASVQTQITENWTGESKHRRSVTTRGQSIGAFLLLSAIVGAVVCGLNGAPYVGGAIIVAVGIGVGLSGIARFFMR